MSEIFIKSEPEQSENLNNENSLKNRYHSARWRSLHLSRAKLKASSRVSALLAGFAMIAIIELEIPFSNRDSASYSPVPNSLLYAYSVFSSLLVVVHILGLLISTCILPHLEPHAISNESASLSFSPHEELRWFIELSWIFSTGIGIFLFLIVVVLAFWIKFYRISMASAVIATCIISLIIFAFVIFSIIFYKLLAKHKINKAEIIVHDLNRQLSDLEKHGSGIFHI